MTIIAKRFFSFKDTSGVLHFLPEQQPLVQRVEATITCDGPHCNPDGEPTTYSWTETEGDENLGELIPDGAFRVITAEFIRGEGSKAFCSVRCLKQYADRVYVTPLSPREQEEQRRRNEAVEASKAVQLMDSEAEREEPEPDGTLN